MAYTDWALGKSQMKVVPSKFQPNCQALITALQLETLQLYSNVCLSIHQATMDMK